MDVTYNSEYSDEVLEKWTGALDKPELMARYSIKVDGGFGFPPILIANRYRGNVVGQTQDDQFSDLVLHYCVLKRKVTVCLDVKELFSFISNSLTDTWEALAPGFVTHPIAFNVLLTDAGFSVMEKYIQPLRSVPAAVEGEGQ